MARPLLSASTLDRYVITSDAAIGQKNPKDFMNLSQHQTGLPMTVFTCRNTSNQNMSHTPADLRASRNMSKPADRSDQRRALHPVLLALLLFAAQLESNLVAWAGQSERTVVLPSGGICVLRPSSLRDHLTWVILGSTQSLE